MSLWREFLIPLCQSKSTFHCGHQNCQSIYCIGNPLPKCVALLSHQHFIKHHEDNPINLSNSCRPYDAEPSSIVRKIGILIRSRYTEIESFSLSCRPYLFSSLPELINQSYFDGPGFERLENWLLTSLEIPLNEYTIYHLIAKLIVELPSTIFFGRQCRMVRTRPLPSDRPVVRLGLSTSTWTCGPHKYITIKVSQRIRVVDGWLYFTNHKWITIDIDRYNFHSSNA